MSCRFQNSYYFGCTSKPELDLPFTFFSPPENGPIRVNLECETVVRSDNNVTGGQEGQYHKFYRCTGVTVTQVLQLDRSDVDIYVTGGQE